MGLCCNENTDLVESGKRVQEDGTQLVRSLVIMEEKERERAQSSGIIVE